MKDVARNQCWKPMSYSMSGILNILWLDGGQYKLREGGQ